MSYYLGPQYPENWNKLRHVIFKRDRYICQRCGRYCKGIADCHHIKPIGKGGSHSMDNLVTLCHYCHEEISIHRNYS
jgi:5-methylcytosine-specific restriction endonuclease McrA